MKASIVTIALVFSYFFTISQSTVVDYTIIGNKSSEYSTDLDTLNGFLYLVGNTNECGSKDGFVIKFREDSVYQRKIIGTESIDLIESIAITSSDTLFVGGFTNRNNDYDIYLAKLDTQLNVIKAKELELENWNFCYDLAINNTAVLGVGKTHNGVDYDGFIFKVNANLDTIWTTTIANTGNQQLTKVISYNDSIFIACGYTEVIGLAKEVYLVSFNANTGAILWTTNIGGSNDDFGNSIIKTQDGGIVGFGTTSSYTSSNEDTFLFKVDSAGLFMWSNLHQVQDPSNTLNENGIDLVELQNGDLVVAAFTESLGGPEVKSTMIMKTNSNGDWMNGYIYDGGSDDYPTAMIKLSDTSIYVAGIANSNSFGYSDSYLLNINTVDVNNSTTITKKKLDLLCYVSIEEDRPTEQFKIYPNPIVEDFKLVTKETKEVVLSVYNLIGSNVFSSVIYTNTAIHFPSYLPQGVYVLEINDKDVLTHYKIVYAK